MLQINLKLGIQIHSYYIPNQVINLSYIHKSWESANQSTALSCSTCSLAWAVSIYSTSSRASFTKACTRPLICRAKRPHYNRFTSNYEICTNTAGLVLLPYIVGWIMALIYNSIFLKERVAIPHKNSALTAFAVLTATYFSLLAIQRTSFPVVIMF